MWPPGVRQEELGPAGDVWAPCWIVLSSFCFPFFFSLPLSAPPVIEAPLGLFRSCCTIGETEASRAGPEAHTRQSVVGPLFFSVALSVFLFLPFLFDFFCCGRQKAHVCGLEIYGGILRTYLAVRSLLGSEGFLFRFGIGLRDLVSEILWAEKSKPASRGPTGECSRARGQLNKTRLCHTRPGP